MLMEVCDEFVVSVPPGVLELPCDLPSELDVSVD